MRSPGFRSGAFGRLGAGVLFLGAILSGFQPVEAQIGGDCDVPSHNGLVTLSLSNGSRITYFSYPTIVCSGTTRISADSAVVYEATNYTQLYNHVVFQDADSRLTADQAHYFADERRLRAWGRVILNDLTEGSIIRGDTMIMLRAGPGRPEDQLTVRGTRPHATLYPTPQPIQDDREPGEGEGVEAPPESPSDSLELVRPDSGVTVVPDSALGAPPDSVGGAVVDTASVAPPDSAEAVGLDSAEVVAPLLAPVPPRPVPQEERTPYEIRARRMYLEGSRYFRATGTVTINRDSVNAAADSVEYDESQGTLFLASEASLTTSAYELTAATILLEIPQDEIRSVLARRDALLEGENLWLLAPTIVLGLTEGQVENLTALQAPLEDSTVAEEGPRRRPPPEVQEMGLQAFPERPHAFAEDFLLWADSIEVLAPDQTLEEVWAMGAAHGESLSRDSLNTEATDSIAHRDWLEGDTIVAIFLPTADSAAVETELIQGVDPARPPSAGGVSQAEAQGDSTRYRLDHLIARVGARSLYRLAPTDSTLVEEDRRLAIHYVLGDEITIFMSGGEVDRMEVTGETRGIHLEPIATNQRRVRPDTSVLPPDTASAGSDTTRALRPDTTGVLPDTVGARPEPTLAQPGSPQPGRFPENPLAEPILTIPTSAPLVRRKRSGGWR